MQLHCAHGNCGADILIQSLSHHHGNKFRHLYPYIRRLECDACLLMHGHREYRTEKTISTKRKRPIDVSQEDMPTMLADASGPWGKLQIEHIVPAVGGSPVLEATSRLMVEKGVSVNVISFKNESRWTVDSGNSVFKNSVAKSIPQLQSLQKQLNNYRQELGDNHIHKQIIPTVEQVPASELRIDWAEAL